MVLAHMIYMAQPCVYHEACMQSGVRNLCVSQDFPVTGKRYRGKNDEATNSALLADSSGVGIRFTREKLVRPLSLLPLGCGYTPRRPSPPTWWHCMEIAAYLKMT